MDYHDYDIPATSATIEVMEGTPSMTSNGQCSDASNEPSSETDLQPGSNDDYEGTLSESSIDPASNTSAESSSTEDVCSVPEDDLEGTPSKSSIGHCSDAPTEPDSDTEEYALGIRQPVMTATKHQSTTTARSYYACSQPAVRHFTAAHATVQTQPARSAGTPVGLANGLLLPSKDQEGTPSCSALGPLASSPSRPTGVRPTEDFEQQLTRILSILAERKRDVTIHIAAADSSAQLAQLHSHLSIVGEATYARQLEEQAVAAEDAWLKHLATLADDSAAYAAARRRYDTFCEEYGLYANLERAKELVAMLRDVYSQLRRHHLRLYDLQADQKNDAFIIVGKMPPVKLHKLPGTPGSSVLPSGRSDKEGHGTPCIPPSRPLPSEKPSHRGQTATRAQPRPYCAFCRRHDHWSSDCTSHDGRARWAFVKKFQLCHQCLHGGHRCADCHFANRRCRHCAACHHAALCPRAHGWTPSPPDAEACRPAFQQADVPSTPVSGHSSVTTATEDRRPPATPTTFSSESAQQMHDGCSTITIPLDAKPPSSSSTLPGVSPAVANVELPTSLANAIAPYFQRNSAGSDVVVGLYVRSQDDAGRTFYRMFKPMDPSIQLPLPVSDLYAHLHVDRVIMLETIAHVLAPDHCFAANATPGSTAHALAARCLSSITPLQATVMPAMPTAVRTPTHPHAEPALLASTDPSDPAGKSSASSEASGIPLGPSECDDNSSIRSSDVQISLHTTRRSERQLPLKRTRMWTASNRKKPPTVAAVAPVTRNTSIARVVHQLPTIDADSVQRTIVQLQNGSVYPAQLYTDSSTKVRPLGVNVSNDDNTHEAAKADHHLAVSSPLAGPSTPLDSTGTNAIDDETDNGSETLSSHLPLNPDPGRPLVATAAGGLSPSGQPAAVITVQQHPVFGHLPVATAAGGRSPSGRSADAVRNPGFGHPSVAHAAEGRSPPVPLSSFDATPNKDKTTPLTIEDRTSTEPTAERLHRAREKEAKHTAMITDHSATLVSARKHTCSATLVNARKYASHPSSTTQRLPHFAPFWY